MDCSIEKELIEKTISFHGHSCPGLAIGIRVAELALKKLGDPKHNDFIAIVETDMCGVDAIQFLTGCTFGKGNLIHKDYGKMAFNFYERKRNIGFSAILRPDISGNTGSELRSLNKKVANGTANVRELSRIEELKQFLIERYMNMELENMFIIGEPRFPIPRPARILQSLRCEACGEMTMESRTRRFDGRILCIPCFDKEEQKI
jgi:formylmethanofuran dehydrogenase subunit E